MQQSIRKLLVRVLVVCVSVASPVFANENLIDGSAASVQRAINRTPQGGLVTIRNGSYEWNQPVSNNGKVVHLVAETLGGVTIKRNYPGNTLNLVASPSGYVEVGGIHFESDLEGAKDNYSYTMTVEQLAGLPVLIHDCSFVTGYEYALQIRGNGGVIWNCSFATKSDGLGGITFVNTSTTCEPWNQPDTMGGSPTKYGTGDPTGTRNTYVESCYFRDARIAMSNWDDNSRVVWRNNEMDNAACGSHGQETGPWGTRHWEVYGCTFKRSTSGKAFGGTAYPLGLNYWLEIRGGTGVVTNNKMDAIPSKGGVQLNVFSINRLGQIPCQTGYPAAHQVGQGWSSSSKAPFGTPIVRQDGVGAVSDPLYVWNNTGSLTTDPNYVALNQYQPDECGKGQKIGTFLQRNRDYFINAAMPGWTPFTYPHPLRKKAVGSTGSSPLPLPENSH